jgi:ATP-dependent DNA helicase
LLTIPTEKEIANKKLQNPVMQARLACNSPHNFYWPWGDDSSTVDETLVTASGKMLLLDRLVPCLMQKGHKVLIFSQFKTQLDLLQDWATQLRSWNCCRIDGAVSQTDRQAQIKAFNTDKDYRIFLLSTRAGGQGINLTAADTVILYDSDWNPQQDLQAQDRAHRIGQTRPVIVYRLATKGTVEQTLLQKADSKRRLERLVIQKGKFKSLLDNGASSAQNDVEELRKALGEDEFEQFDIQSDDPESILSQEELRILTDRSEEAYTRVEKGLEKGGRAFTAVETQEDQGIMAELSAR